MMAKTTLCSPVRLHSFPKENKVKAMVSIKISIAWVFVQILAIVDRGTVTFVLSTIATLLVIAYHIIRIRKEVKGKSNSKSYDGEN
jgi:hypothetical protein